MKVHHIQLLLMFTNTKIGGHPYFPGRCYTKIYCMISYFCLLNFFLVEQDIFVIHKVLKLLFPQSTIEKNGKLNLMSGS